MDLQAKHKNRYFVSAFGFLDVQHGGVGNRDIETILSESGYRKILLPESNSIAGIINRLLAFWKWTRKIQPGSEIVFQFPIYARLHQRLLKDLSRKGVKVIILLTDIDGLKDGNEHLLIKELKLLKYASQFVAQTPNMAQWLHDRFPHTKTTVLGPFDFLAEPVFKKRHPGFELAFAGNLAKSRFLENLDAVPQIQFHLYGPGATPKMQSPSNAQWHGSFPAEQLPLIMKGNFGLVWEGDSVSGPQGPLGEYTRYINHHKLSLYILSGLPVIAAAFSGSAAFIQQHDIGWLVNDLHEIPGLIERITGEEYRKAVENIAPIAEKLCSGRNLLAAVGSRQSAV